MQQNITMAILIWTSEHGKICIAARNDDEEKRAYLHLFNHMDDMNFYRFGLDGTQLALYGKARQGDAQAAKYLIRLRSQLGYEYELVEKEYVIIPYIL